MTKIDQIKILNNKIKANKTQYMLDRKNTEISAKSSGELDKYEYLTGEDLGYKPDALTQAEFEYSPWGNVFTAGLDKADKNQGNLKRLKNVEDKSGNQLTVLNNLFNRTIGGRNNGGNRGLRGFGGNDDDDDDDDDDDRGFRDDDRGFRDDDDDDDDDDKRKFIKDYKDFKSQEIQRGNLDENGSETFNKIANITLDLQNKKVCLSKRWRSYGKSF